MKKIAVAIVVVVVAVVVAVNFKPHSEGDIFAFKNAGNTCIHDAWLARSQVRDGSRGFSLRLVVTSTFVSAATYHIPSQNTHEHADPTALLFSRFRLSSPLVRRSRTACGLILRGGVLMGRLDQGRGSELLREADYSVPEVWTILRPMHTGYMVPCNVDAVFPTVAKRLFAISLEANANPSLKNDLPAPVPLLPE